MNLDILIINILANLNCGLPWLEWDYDEQSLFALSFHERGTSSVADFQNERRNLLRKLFNRLNILDNPSFICNHYKKIGNKERYRPLAHELRKLLIKKTLPRKGTLPPIF
jgi:hypothetical protein